eukprot:3948150-Pyramimonas_sp.AAC.1
MTVRSSVSGPPRAVRGPRRTSLLVLSLCPWGSLARSGSQADPGEGVETRGPTLPTDPDVG